MIKQETLDLLLAANQKASEATNSDNKTITVISVTDWRPTTKGNLPVKMVRAIVDGKPATFFPLASAITNLPGSFSKPVQANAVLTLRKDVNGVDRLNMSRLEFSGLATEALLAIKAMPQGTALFASAAGIALN